MISLTCFQIVKKYVLSIYLPIYVSIQGDSMRENSKASDKAKCKCEWWRVHESSFSYSCKFSASLKLYQNRKLYKKGKGNRYENSLNNKYILVIRKLDTTDNFLVR